MFLDLIKHLLECFEPFQKRPRVLHFIAYKLRTSILNVLIQKCQTATPEITEVVETVVQIHCETEIQFKRLLALIRTV